MMELEYGIRTRAKNRRKKTRVRAKIGQIMGYIRYVKKIVIKSNKIRKNNVTTKWYKAENFTDHVERLTLLRVISWYIGQGSAEMSVMGKSVWILDQKATFRADSRLTEHTNRMPMIKERQCRGVSERLTVSTTIKGQSYQNGTDVEVRSGDGNTGWQAIERQMTKLNDSELTKNIRQYAELDQLTVTMPKPKWHIGKLPCP